MLQLASRWSATPVRTGDRTAGAVTRSDRTAPWRVASAVVTALAAAVTIASSVTPDLSARARVLDAFEPTGIQAVAHIAGALAGLGLLALCPALLRGERRAGRRTVALLCAVAVVHAVKGLDVEEALVALGAAAVVGLGLRRTGPGAWPGRATAAAAAVGVALLGLYAGSLAWVLARGVPEDLGAAALQAAGVAWSLAEGAATAAVQGDWRLLLHVLGSAAVVAAALVLRALVAPPRARDGHDAAAHGRAAALVAAHGTDSIAPFVLRADKAFFFAHGGVLAYRTLRETAVVSGDPVGPAGPRRRSCPASWPSPRPRLGRRRPRRAATRIWRPTGRSACGRCRSGSRRESTRGLLPRGRRAQDGAQGRAPRQRRGWTIELVSGARADGRRPRRARPPSSAPGGRRPRLYGFAMAMDRLWGAPEDAHDLYVLARAPTARSAPSSATCPTAAASRSTPCAGSTTSPTASATRSSPRRSPRARRRVRRGLAELRRLRARDGGRRPSSAAATGSPAGRCAGCTGASSSSGSRASPKFGPVWRPRHLVYTTATRLPLAALRVMQAEAYVRPPRARPRRDAGVRRTSPSPRGR